MTAVFTDFDSTMAERIVVDSANGTVDVTFRNSGSTYRFGLSQPEISDIVSVVTARSKGKLLHQLLDIRNGELVQSLPANVAVPNVAKTSSKKTSKVTGSGKVKNVNVNLKRSVTA